MASIKKHWDLEARWHGKLEPSERQQLKKWLDSERWRAQSDLKLGLERHRLHIVFNQKALESETQRHFDLIKNAQQLQGLDEQALEAIKELMEGQLEPVASALIRPEYQKVVQERWIAQHASVLEGIIPSTCGLTIRIGAPKVEKSKG